MAKSRQEYVKNFEVHSTILPSTWMVARLDGNSFTKFCETHGFVKPNDIRALSLMNEAAIYVCKQLPDIVVAYGQSDEYSFIFSKKSNVYGRRIEKILSIVISMFTSAYVYNWNRFFDIPLQHPPVFDGRIVCYPNDEIMMDYMRWRQADCHVNNLYNTIFWAIVHSGKTTTEAHEQLKGSTSAVKNERLFTEFGINYNNEPEIFRKGTALIKPLYEPTHEDVFKEEFYRNHGIIE
ncbi:unnamed protein product [Blepharisma stoltei]|uniref:tRNA(His) guanylyltransferase n=1 Tax=Blepharisma stoltei TaxID=1481888 RepID=A0AAU9JKD1_9CILI|nr:unnamed protein product [Blepharisma stoltei]